MSASKRPFGWRFFLSVGAIAVATVFVALIGAEYDELNERQANLDLILFRQQQVLQQISNTEGPIGPQGDRGEKGDKGDKGDKGEKGDKGLNQLGRTSDAPLPREALVVYLKNCPAGWEQVLTLIIKSNSRQKAPREAVACRVKSDQ